MGTIKLKWEGDLEDDCHCRVGSLSAHAERLDDIKWSGSGERTRHDGALWYCSVCYVNSAGFVCGDHLFHSGEYGGIIVGGEMARAICEAVIRAALLPPPRRRLRRKDGKQ